MTNHELLSVAMRQSAEDMGCAAGDFLREDNVVAPLRLGARARKYLKLPIVCNLISYGSNVVGAVTETMINGNLEQVFKNVIAVSREQVCDGTTVLPWLSCGGIVISGK